VVLEETKRYRHKRIALDLFVSNEPLAPKGRNGNTDYLVQTALLKEHLWHDEHEPLRCLRWTYVRLVDEQDRIPCRRKLKRERVSTTYDIKRVSAHSECVSGPARGRSDASIAPRSRSYTEVGGDARRPTLP
jgi:hypothetical protein